MSDRYFKHEIAIVDGGAEIGAATKIASALINKAVPGFATVVALPAKRVSWVCKCGVQLDSDQCSSCGMKYVIEGESCQVA